MNVLFMINNSEDITNRTVKINSWHYRNYRLTNAKMSICWLIADLQQNFCYVYISHTIYFFREKTYYCLKCLYQMKSVSLLKAISRIQDKYYERMSLIWLFFWYANEVEMCH